MENDKIEIYVWCNKSLLCNYNANIIPRINETIIIKHEEYRVIDVVHEIYSDGKELTCINIKCIKLG
jgi:hypothetical protein